jgi:hypothetical protein
LALFALMIVAMSSPASAQDGPSAGPSNCVKFSGDQAAAQAYFEAGGGSANNNYEGLDDDGNGIACDEPGVFEGGGPSAGTESGPAGIDCASFNGDQAAAQAYFDANDQPDALDGDGDGQACASPEDGDYTSKPSAGPETDTGSGAASAETETESVSEGASTTTSSDDTVSDLPVAGSGLALPTAPGSVIGLLLGMSLIFGTSALHGNRLVRR